MKVKYYKKLYSLLTVFDGAIITRIEASQTKSNNSDYVNKLLNREVLHVMPRTKTTDENNKIKEVVLYV